jgi:hypothetical protein
MISASASTRLATSAPSVSLSPNLISSVTTVSFSLMIGTTPSCSRVRQRRAGVEVALAVGQVVVREQDLRGVQAVLAEKALHRPATSPIWPTAAAGLQFVDGLRALAPAQALHAAGDGARGNQHDLLASARRARSGAPIR